MPDLIFTNPKIRRQVLVLIFSLILAFLAQANYHPTRVEPSRSVLIQPVSDGGGSSPPPGNG